MDVTSQVLSGSAPASAAVPPASNNPTPNAPVSGATTANAATPGAPGAPVAGQPAPAASPDPATGTVQAAQGAAIQTPAPGATGATGTTGATGAAVVTPTPSLVDRLNADDATNQDMETRMAAVETRLAAIIDAHNAHAKAAAATNGSGMVTADRFNKLVKAVFGDPNAI